MINKKSGFQREWSHRKITIQLQIELVIAFILQERFDCIALIKKNR